jgi:enoyl-CoA hydratase
VTTDRTDATGTSEAVLTEQHGRVLLITLNRPEAMNAVNAALADGLVAAIQRLDDDPGLTIGVLTGNGRGFCAGMDLKAFAKGENLSSLGVFTRNGAKKPLIAAIEGFALGGGLELALSCDLLVAGKGAKLGIPEVTVGLFAGAGGLLRLPNRVGYSKATEMAITGVPVLAEEAFEIGLVSRLAEKGSAAAIAMDLAELVAKNAPLAVAASKEIIKGALGLTEPEFWKFQAPYIASVFKSNDAKEGPQAFAEKRAPVWSGT